MKIAAAIAAAAAMAAACVEEARIAVPSDLAAAHTIDESVPVVDVVACAQALAVAAMRFCGVAP